MKRIACLHAHHSNIALLADAFAALDVELVHFVDPGILLQSTGAVALAIEQAHAKLRDHLQWMSQCSADAVIITCTQYASYLTPEDEASFAVPIFTIDGPLLQELSLDPGAKLLLFSNPATVEPTMNRLRSYAQAAGSDPAIELHIIANSFDLLMANRQEAYYAKIKEALHHLQLARPGIALAAAQLSMGPAVEQFSRETGQLVAHPLKSLTSNVCERLSLTRYR